MNRIQRLAVCGILAFGASGFCRREGDDDDGWVSLFDGKTFSGWTKAGEETRASGKSSTGPSWARARRRCSTAPREITRISVSGPRSRSTTTAIRGCTSAGRPTTATFPTGYEAQIDSTHRDPIRTGSIYGFLHIYKQLVPPDTWFTYEVECVDKNWRGSVVPHIKVWVNGELLFELHREDQAVGQGLFCLPAARPRQQGRDPQDRSERAERIRQVAAMTTVNGAPTDGLPAVMTPARLRARDDSTEGRRMGITAIDRREEPWQTCG